MSALDMILDHLRYAGRPQQAELFNALRATTSGGVVVQAGTGTGKSIGVLAAAAEWHHSTGMPSLIITPTKALQDQYMKADGPAVEAALGLKVRMLKGRANYPCPNAPAWDGLAEETVPFGAQHMVEPERARLLSADIEFVAQRTDLFGCPGAEECGPADAEECHYQRARADLEDADIIVTNTTMWIIDYQMAQRGQTREDGSIVRLFPEYGVLLVDEAHMLESTMRDFATQALNTRVLDSLGAAGEPLKAMLERANTRDAKAFRLPAAKARPALEAVKAWRPAEGAKPKQRQADAVAAAAKMIRNIDDGYYDSSDVVMWFDPAPEGRSPRLVSTTISIGGQSRAMLTAQPFALVSATVPQSMPQALGVPQIDYLDVGHPFDYAKQATIAFSGWSGASAVAADTRDFRVEEVYRHIMSTGGGALVLFSAFSDLNYVHEALVGRLQRQGLTVLMQDRDSDKKWLGEQFKADGNAVLFGSDTFATGFDCPGTALRNVIVWKAPYPALDPVNRAIQSKSFKRYEDAMLMKVVQGIGRLIRTSTDTGSVYIADSRLRAKFRDPRDPMVRHIKDFSLVEAR